MYVRAAGPITITVLSIAISNIFKLYKGPHKIAVVGSIPQVLHTAKYRHAWQRLTIACIWLLSDRVCCAAPHPGTLLRWQ